MDIVTDTDFVRVLFTPSEGEPVYPEKLVVAGMLEAAAHYLRALAEDTDTVLYAIDLVQGEDGPGVALYLSDDRGELVEDIEQDIEQEPS